MTFTEIVAAMLFVATQDVKARGDRVPNFAEYDLLRTVYG